MPRRIIGQCSITDFKDLEQLARQGMGQSDLVKYFLDNPVTYRKNVAIMVVRHLQSCGVPFKVALKIREVLVWELADKTLVFQFRLLDLKDLETAQILRHMRPRVLNDERSGKHQ